ncbi:MAG TPA: substrate-binding domain-containing protein [Thermoleophilia bacterium]|nr:substrate-binding domain-containing protein [Thermoleophilia bacterium]
MDASTLLSGKRAALAVLALVVLFLPAACGSGSDEAAVQRDQLIVATTTSLNDSGLLEDVVLPAYAQIAPDVTVKVIAVGSGEALAMGERGEADVLMVHSPSAEEELMAAGYGTLRLQFAYNYFTIVGPEGDPAGVGATASAAEGFAAIAASGAVFVSRGDQSGTHTKELKLWEGAGVEPVGDWYLSTGQGMGETLRIASEKEGYTLTDVGTYLAQADTLDLVPLAPESADLQNTYSVILIDQNRFTAVNAAAAERLAQYLVSAEGQQAIDAFGEDTYGQSLFRPYAETLGSY